MINKKQISRILSKALRHKPESLQIVLDKNGWAIVNEIINNSKIQCSIEDLKDIVKTNDKQRFAFNEDFTKIRANQGHSIKVELDLEKVIPPTVLYHGTSENNSASILKYGILKRNRHHVHLSSDKVTAQSVGARHGKPIIFEIDTKEMVKHNIKFFKSENEVYLVDYVDPKYLKQIKQ
jgi:putative RNA 2'-phosphotransferase